MTTKQITDNGQPTVGYLYGKGEISLRFQEFDAGLVNLALSTLGRMVGKVEHNGSIFYRFKMSREGMQQTADYAVHPVGRDELAHLYDVLYYHNMRGKGLGGLSARTALNSYTNVLAKLRGGVDIVNYDLQQQVNLNKRMGGFVPNPGRWIDYHAHNTYRSAFMRLAEFGKAEQADEISKSLTYWRLQRSEHTGEVWGDYALAMIWLRRFQVSIAEGRTSMLHEED